MRLGRTPSERPRSTCLISLRPGALVVGRDMRTSSPRMAAAFIDGVLSRGVDVIDIGLSSTDELWFASGSLDLPGAMFTASHNPADYNGIKFCLAAAKPITSASLTEIADRASGPEPTPVATPGSVPSRTCCPRTRTTCTPWST